MTLEKHNSDILPGERVGRVGLADSLDDVVEKLAEYTSTWEDLPHHRVLHGGPYRIWFDKATGEIAQALVGPGFGGRFLGAIGVGSTLGQLKQVAGPYYEKDDAYFLQRHRGVCFELQDVEDWDERTAPIEFITVFPPSDSPSHQRSKG